MIGENSRSAFRPLAILVAGAIGFALPVQAAIKCWTNKDGVRECGNAVPPEYAQQGHEQLNKRGIVVDEQERAKTEAELEVEREAAAEAAAQAERDRLQAEKDRVLIDTYSSVDDLELTRDGRIDSIEGQIKLTESQVEKLRKNLDEIIATAAELEREGRKPSEKVQQDIDNVNQQIARKQAFIDGKRREQDQVRTDFAEQIARFKAIRGDF